MHTEHSSEIDNEVRQRLSDKSHTFEVIDYREYCLRCGKPKEQLRKEDGTFLPCRGFIGGI